MLDHAGAGRSGDDRGHGGDVDGVGAVAAGADHVDSRARRSRSASRSRASCRRARRAPRPSRPCTAAPPRTPPAAPGVASPLRICSHRPGRGLVRQILTGHQPAEDVRPGAVGRSGTRVRHVRRDRRARLCSTAATRRRPRAAGAGSTGCGTTPSARDQVASHASSRRAGEHQDRRAAEDLVLQLAAQPHARRARPHRPGWPGRCHRGPSRSAPPAGWPPPAPGPAAGRPPPCGRGRSRTFSRVASGPTRRAGSSARASGRSRVAVGVLDLIGHRVHLPPPRCASGIVSRRAIVDRTLERPASRTATAERRLCGRG